MGGVWLGGWILIILLRAISLKRAQSGNHVDRLVFSKFDREMVTDGNNLFATGVAYMLGLVLCHFVRNTILCWILLSLGVLFCLPSIFSLVVILFTQGKIYFDKIAIHSLFTSIINTFVPLVMALSIYFSYIR